MKCPTCGTENDAANRFCDQCGSRLEPSGVSPQVAAAIASQPTAAAATCPSCGAVVLPGEAFCDECGASLSGAVPASGAASYDAPTVYAPPMPRGPTAPANAAAPASAAGVTCPACGHQNMPGDRFCDNCGAGLPSASNEAAPTKEAPPAEPPKPQEAPPAEPPKPQEAPPAEPSTSARAAADLPTVEQPALGSAADYENEKRRLTEEIARQQQIITQFEQMQATFGAATPAAVTQGLAEARDGLTRAQAEFDALKPPAPPIDPAEVTRLTEEIARQQQIITQFEQMQATFGAATPAAVTQGLAEARAALARTQAEFDALGAGAAPAPTPEAPAAPVAAPPQPVAVAPPPAPTPAAPPEAPAAPVAAPPQPVAVAPPPVAVPVSPVAPVAAPPRPAVAPRLVVEDGGRELPLPTDKAEIIVGREDPISGIFPEIDLTPYGGEGGGVSRQHARISRANGQWMITDLNSTNYTRVDGNKIDPSLPVPISDGVRIQFGRVAVTFRE